MEEEKIIKRIEITNKILPWFMALTDDLMFFISVSTLFFKIVKNYTLFQITFLTTIFSMTYLLLQIPLLKIIKKIGNIKSIRIATFLLLCASILITFGTNYIITIIGYIFFGASVIFKTMDNIILEKNLIYMDKKENYIKELNKSKIIYSVITTIIALIGGMLFNINNYLPMYLCILVCFINFMTSFFIVEVEYTKIENKKDLKQQFKFSNTIILILISYALLYSIISIGQDNIQLFAQINLEKSFEINKTATYLGIIIMTSRIARILGNLIFKQKVSKIKDKINIILPTIAIIAFGFVHIGNILKTYGTIKIIFITIGFDLILAIRDPIQINSRALILRKTEDDKKQQAISYLELSRRISETIINTILSIMLIKIQLIYIINILAILTIISLIINTKLYKIIRG